MKVAANPGMMLLGIWLLMTGLGPLLNINFPPLIVSGVAVAAGVLILMKP